MRGGDERRLKLRGRQPDALIEQVAMEAAEGDRVRFRGLVVVRHRPAREEPRPHGADAVGGEDNVGACSFLGNALGDGAGGGFEPRIDLSRVFLQIADGGQSRGHGQRIAAQRSGLIDRPQRRQKIHELALAAEDADGQAAAHNLAQRDQVGIERVELAGAAQRHAKAGHHFIHDQQSPILRRDPAQAGEIAIDGAIRRWSSAAAFQYVLLINLYGLGRHLALRRQDIRTSILLVVTILISRRTKFACSI